MKKTYFYYFCYALLIFLIEAAGGKVFKSEGYLFPQLSLLLILIVTMKRPFSVALWLSFFAGLASELFSGLAFGTYIFSFLSVSLLVFVVTRKITTQEVSLPNSVLLVAIGSMFFLLSAYVYDLLLFLLSHGINFPITAYFGTSIFWTIFLNLICFYPIKLSFDLLPKSDRFQ